MTTPECPRTTLVEALRDGRLGPQECASMERHLENCAECAAFARDLALIGEAIRAPRERATPLEHQRARVALLQRAAALPAARSSFDKRRLLLGAVAMVAALALGWSCGHFSASTNQVAVAMHIGMLPRFDPVPKMGLHPSDDARFTRNRTGGLDEVALEHGALEIKLRPLAAGERFVVRTKDAKIEVRATALRIEAGEGRIRSVAVEQGTVDVEYAGFTATITTGGSWRATAETPESAKPADNNSSGEIPAAPSTRKTAVRTTPRGDTRVLEEAPMPESAPIALPNPESTVAVPSPVPSSPPAAPEVSPASRGFAEAMAALRRGDYVGSADKLEQFASAHPNDARADEADYLRAIALQRAGRTAEAIAAAKRYLAKRPNGAHRADALRIVGK